MKKTLGLELYSELKQAFGDIYCRVLWAMALTSFALAIFGLFKSYDVLCSTATELFIFTLVFAVIGTISYIHVQRKVKNYLKSLTTDEKDLLIYVYNYSKKVTNAVYVPYDNAIAISLKYKRILRRYDTPIRVARKKGDSEGSRKFCFLYGIRKMPKDFIKSGKLKGDGLPSTRLRAELDRYQ